ncbi:unnamed protein product [Ceratitis capitata]|uniref:(Mediterranean fruit fly) hypothetical protein n=1 Tax=Ceratitis capitata TaxID=7213 RepID=A0A811VH58_CERCA|nr:unnamed protein product [Ceratitis capitata]
MLPADLCRKKLKIFFQLFFLFFFLLLANIYNQSASTQAINEPFIPTSPLTANKSTLKEGNKGNAYIKKYKKKKKKKSIEPNKSTYGMHNLTLSECAEHKAVR